MEQMYLIEIFIDKVTVFLKEDQDSGGKDKKLIIRTSFGPNIQSITREGQLVNEYSPQDDTIEVTPSGRRQYSRVIRVGKSFLFPSYPDTIITMLAKFPISIEVWTDDDSEPDYKLYIGVGKMQWHTKFYNYLKETADACKINESLTIKDIVTLYEECCCGLAGEISIILRLSALGSTIITEFQQIMRDPDRFCFRTNKTPSMFECKRIDGDDPNFCMIGSLYETTTLADPDIIRNAQTKIEVCTELESCGTATQGHEAVCQRAPDDEIPKKRYTINKIRMGDITGPCGNTNCPLAHKVRMYVRNLDSYKQKAGNITEKKTEGTRKICGTCGCKDDRWHREECPEDKGKRVTCGSCGGTTAPGDTCKDRLEQHYDTGNTPKPSPKPSEAFYKDNTKHSEASKVSIKTPESTSMGSAKPSEIASKVYESPTKVSPKASELPSNPSSKAASEPPSKLSSKTTAGSNPDGNKQVQYVTEVSKFKDAIYKRDYFIENCYCTRAIREANNDHAVSTSKTPNAVLTKSYSCGNVVSCTNTMTSSKADKHLTQHFVYNAETSTGNKTVKLYNVCTEIAEDKDCRCSPPKPSPPCKTFDCTCIQKIVNTSLRKAHRPYCPLYVHKNNCPVTIQHEDEEKKEEEEDEPEPLPYGLPPIQLGPCPVMGRPCSVSDGFARMYKTAVLPTQPPSYSDAGKVCCSKEYERIKKAIKEYMKYQKENDMRCVNRFNVDTERRCCDKEQVLLALMGRECCGTHKLAIQEKFKGKK